MKNFQLSGLAFLLVVSTLVTDSTPAGNKCPTGPSKCWETKNVIDSRIDVYAQQAMLKMFAKGADDAAKASAMLCAIKREELAGIYLPEQKKAALRAQALGTWYGKLMPSDQEVNAICVTKPDGALPLIVFRKKIGPQKERLVNALKSAWRECGIAETPPICYQKTISRPPSSPPPSVQPPSSEPPDKPPFSSPPDKSKEKRKCPSRTTYDPARDVCVCDTGGVYDPVSDLCDVTGGDETTRPCTEKQMSMEFNRNTDFCLPICIPIAANCNPPLCNATPSQCLEKCVVSTTIGEKRAGMECYPGTDHEIGQKYQVWRDRTK